MRHFVNVYILMGEMLMIVLLTMPGLAETRDTLRQHKFKYAAPAMIVAILLWPYFLLRGSRGSS